MIPATGLMVLGLYLAVVAMNTTRRRWTAALGIGGGLSFVAGLRLLS